LYPTSILLIKHQAPVKLQITKKVKRMKRKKRKRVFIPSWTTTYPWLQNGISRMTCTVCTKFDTKPALSLPDAKTIKGII